MTPRPTRVLALVLADLPIEVARRAAPALALRPLALVARARPRRAPAAPRAGRRGAAAPAPARPARTAGVVRVVAASAEARARGVRPGSTGAQALAAAPDLALREHAPEADAAALAGLAGWAAFALGPRVGVVTAGADAWPALVVDVAGTARVLGPEADLPGRARRGLAALGHTARVALADTPLAALALAAWGPPEGVVVAPGATRAALAPLPPRALPLPAPALEALARLGVTSLAGLLALPRLALAPRLGEATLEVLDRALGARDDPIAPAPLPDALEERLEVDLADRGAERRPDVALAVELLAGRLAARLAAVGRGARALELLVSRDRSPGEARRPPERLAVRLAAPVGQARGLARALEPWLERLDLSRPVRALTLRAPETAPLPPRQLDLFDPDAHREALEERLAALVTRLEARLGPRRVLRAHVVADHRPERAHAVVPASAAPGPGARAAGDAPPPGPRPTRLLAPPRPLAVEVDPDGAPARVDGRPVLRAAGPERIETGFWAGPEVRRDYWTVALDDGRVWWVFEDLTAPGAWALHGLFD